MGYDSKQGSGNEFEYKPDMEEVTTRLNKLFKKYPSYFEMCGIEAHMLDTCINGGNTEGLLELLVLLHTNIQKYQVPNSDKLVNKIFTILQILDPNYTVPEIDLGNSESTLFTMPAQGNDNETNINCALYTFVVCCCLLIIAFIVVAAVFLRR